MIDPPPVEEPRVAVFRRHKGPALLLSIAVVLAAAIALPIVLSSGPPNQIPRPAASSIATGPFAWMSRQGTPAGWLDTELPGGNAVLVYPSSFKRVRGDAGTVSVARIVGRDRYLAYLNATPKQGGETLGNFASFRVAHLGDDGDAAVHRIAVVVNLALPRARRSCIIDDYTSSVGHHRYREIACLLVGPASTSVIVAASLRSAFARFGPTLERAVAAYGPR